MTLQFTSPISAKTASRPALRAAAFIAWVLLGPVAVYDTLLGLGVTRSVRSLMLAPFGYASRNDDPYDARVALKVAALLWWLPMLAILAIPTVTWALYVGIVGGIPLAALAIYVLIDASRYGWRSDSVN